MPENQSISCKTITLPKKILSFISFISLLILVSTLLVIIGCGGGGGGDEGGIQENIEEEELEKKWDFTTGDKVYSSPAVYTDGTIYIGSDDTYLYALTRDGNLKWRFKTNDAVFSSPVVGEDGTIYVGSNDHNIYAIKPNKDLKWSYTTGDMVLSKPAIGHNGYIYAGSNDGYLYALNPQGQKVWSTPPLNGYVSSPVVGPDGTIYVGAVTDRANSKGKVVALNPDDGSIKWEVSIYTISKPDLGSDNTIYVSSLDKHIYALDSQDGQEKWKYEVEGSIFSSPKVVQGEDEIIIFGSDDKKLYALNNQGTLLWSTILGDQIRSSAQVGNGDTIYIGCHNGYLYACRLEDGSIKGYFKTNRPITSIPAVDEDGVIYFGGQDKKIYAVEDNLI